MTMSPETAIEKFSRWQTKAASLLVVIETEGVRLMSHAATVLDVNASGVSFSLPGAGKDVLLISFKGVSFDEANVFLGNKGLSGLVITFPHGGTCTAQESWSNESKPEPEISTDTDLIQ